MNEGMKTKVGLISCSGEEIPEGTLARTAVRLVLEKLRPESTVTICLPLFLAGDAGERNFAKIFPTITVDGCSKLCAKKGTEKFSGAPGEAINIEELLEKWNVGPPSSRKNLDEEGWKLAQRIAGEISSKVDSLLAEHSSFPGLKTSIPAGVHEPVCSCMTQEMEKTDVSAGGKIVELTAMASYKTWATWREGHRGHIRLGNGPEMDFSAPPSLHGIEGVLTPEDAFVAALNTCYMMMFLWACERFRINLVSYECETEGFVKELIDRTSVFEKAVLRPKIRVRGNTKKDVQKALKSAFKYSLVAQSIKSEILIEPDIEIIEE